MWEVKRNFKISGIPPSCVCKERETTVTNLFFKEPQQLTKFPTLKQSLVENISLQRSNCNIFGLTDIVA